MSYYTHDIQYLDCLNLKHFQPYSQKSDSHAVSCNHDLNNHYHLHHLAYQLGWIIHGQNILCLLSPQIMCGPSILCLFSSHISACTVFVSTHVCCFNINIQMWDIVTKQENFTELYLNMQVFEVTIRYCHLNGTVMEHELCTAWPACKHCIIQHGQFLN